MGGGGGGASVGAAVVVMGDREIGMYVEIKTVKT